MAERSYHLVPRQRLGELGCAGQLRREGQHPHGAGSAAQQRLQLGPGERPDSRAWLGTCGGGIDPRALQVQAQRDGAVRVPKSAWARAVARAAGGLVTSTSANLSGDAAIYDPADVVRAFRGRRHEPALLIDAGPLPARPPSTIVRAGKRGMMEVLRQGAVKVVS